jgi:TP901 family phage tail tape measure protein
MALDRIGLGGVMTFNSTQAVRGMNQASSAAARLQTSTTKLRDARGRYVAQGGQFAQQAHTTNAAFGRMSPKLNQASTAFGNLEQTASRTGGMFAGISAGLRKASESFGKFGAAAGRVIGAVGRGIQQLGGMVTKFGVAASVLTAVMGVGTAKAANFEEQMSAVRAITGATGSEFVRLEDKAKRMGATTVFSATQSGEAMENLARAGFNTSETIDALSGVMAAAAADSIPLATSAQITSQVIRAMGLEASEAGRVADVLALTSARTNTDIIGLGEGFKFAAAQAHVMGIDLETTAAAIGVISDAGIRGTLAGTSFTNMLVKLSRPSSKATQYMRQYKIEIFETAEGNLDLRKTLASVGAGLKDITSKTKRAAVITEIFGIRGQKAVSAIDQAITSGKFERLSNELARANGKAQEMADVRLANLKGAITLAKSAMEGFFLETTGLFLGPTQGNIRKFTKVLGGIVEVLQLINKGVVDSDDRFKKFSPTVIAIAQGIHDAFTDILWAMDRVKRGWDRLLKSMGVTAPETVRLITRIVTTIALAAAVLGPFILAAGVAITAIGGAVAAVGALIGPLSGAIAAIGSAAAAVFPAVLAAIAAVIAIYAVLKADSIKVTDAIRMGIALVSRAWHYLTNNVIMPFVNALLKQVMPIWNKLKAAVSTTLQFISMKWNQVFSGLIQTTRRLAPVFSMVFRLMGTIVGWFARLFMWSARNIVQALRPIISVLLDIAKVIVEKVMNAFIMLVEMIIAAGDAIKAVTGKDLIPTELRQFVSGGIMGAQRFQLTGQTTSELVGFKPTAEKAPPQVSTEEMMRNIGAGAAKGVSDGLARQKGAGAAPPEAKVDVKVEDSRPITLNNNLSVDGREVAIATGRHKQELSERVGFRSTPWQRRLILEHGFAPVGGLSGGY